MPRIEGICLRKKSIHNLNCTVCNAIFQSPKSTTKYCPKCREDRNRVRSIISRLERNKGLTKEQIKEQIKEKVKAKQQKTILPKLELFCPECGTRLRYSYETKLKWCPVHGCGFVGRISA